ncbi:MAG: hypothetical protein QOJ99_426 [Bryobacterales bacterium]|jgi:hypothetical protein|nr:hypothetical protein [Bryobacterales bacterium]
MYRGYQAAILSPEELVTPESDRFRHLLYCRINSDSSVKRAIDRQSSPDSVRPLSLKVARIGLQPYRTCTSALIPGVQQALEFR